MSGEEKMKLKMIDDELQNAILQLVKIFGYIDRLKAENERTDEGTGGEIIQFPTAMKGKKK